VSARRWGRDEKLRGRLFPRPVLRASESLRRCGERDGLPPSHSSRPRRPRYHANRLIDRLRLVRVDILTRATSSFARGAFGERVTVITLVGGAAAGRGAGRLSRMVLSHPLPKASPAKDEDNVWNGKGATGDRQHPPAPNPSR
jgi:hypothetical protein